MTAQNRKPRKKLPTTPRSKVRSALRALFLRSRERAAALKTTGYCCSICGAKQSKAKGREVAIEVHHINGSGIDEIIDLVFEKLLCPPERMQVLCVTCHDKQHEKKED